LKVRATVVPGVPRAWVNGGKLMARGSDMLHDRHAGLGELVIQDVAQQLGEQLARQIAAPFAKYFADAFVEQCRDRGVFATGPKLLPVKAVADRLGRTPKAVRHLIDRGELRAQRIGRRVMVDSDELEAWIRNNRVE